MSASAYQLAFTLHGHASDVRNIVAPTPGLPLLLSASRDGSAIVWGPSQKGREWDVKLRVEGPEKRFVSCAGMVRSNGEAFLLIGSSNGVLSSFILPSPTSPPPRGDALPEPYHTLVEHKQNLCCMDVSKGGLIATGSWDKSVIVWKDFKAAVKIEAHEQAVWAVRFVGEDRLLTAAADNKIILHSIDLSSGRSTPLQEYTGHSQPVRGLSLKPNGKGFWSCGNDSNINVYSFDKPDPVKSLSGHTSFVYSITALPDGSGAISSGEDGTLRVWSETDLVQTIPHAANSLWSSAVVSSATGSTFIASSSQDSTIRFFTKDESLIAPQAERDAWDKDVSSRQLDKSQVGDVKHSDLPGMEALGREGKKDGQVIMIKNEGKVEAYSWSSAEKTWQQIGQVVDAIGNGRKQLYEGKEYDYVFDVDVSEGMPPLKLPYNASENPWVAAQKFLEKNDLPSSYTEQVVAFIEKSTDGVKLGGDSSTFVDPYTGASRYTGGSGSTTSTGYSDPFTGSSAYSTTPAVAPKPKGVLPVRTYLSFKQMNIAAAKTKIASLNEEIKATSSSAAFTEADEANLSRIYALLSQPASTLPDVKKADAGEEYDPGALFSLINRWPEAQRFPLIDLARCLAAISPAFAVRNASAPENLLAACDWDKAWQAGKPRETNTLLALRGLSNLFSTTNGRATMAASAEYVLPRLTTKTWEQVGARKQPLITIALNYSVLVVNNEFPKEQSGALLDLITYVLENETSDSETLYRASVALGNLLVTPSVAGSLQVGQVQKARSLAVERASTVGEKRLTDLAQEIINLGA